MDCGSVVAALTFPAVRFAGFRTVGLEVLSVLRAGMVVSWISEVDPPDWCCSDDVPGGGPDCSQSGCRRHERSLLAGHHRFSHLPRLPPPRKNLSGRRQPNANVDRAAAIKVSNSKPPDPRLCFQRFVMPFWGPLEVLLRFDGRTCLGQTPDGRGPHPNISTR